MKRLALFICTLLCANLLMAQTFTIGDLRYHVYDYGGGITGVSVVAADTTITIANIPETVTYEGVTYAVIKIGYEAFKNCRNLTSVTIPKGVLHMDYYPFDGCTNLRVLNYNAESYRSGFYFYDDLDYYFFRDCPINEINIGEDVRKIPACFAYNLDSLTSITIPNGVDSIMHGAFSRCDNLTSISIDMSHIIGYSYYGSYEPPFNIPSLQNLTLGENVTSIASGAFNDCSFLQNVTCLATTPPTLEDNTVFPYPNIASLNVPCGTLEAYSSATSFWNMFFAGRISENGYNVEVSVNDETFGSVAVESDCSTGTLTATANEGYVFISWNDGNTDNPREVTLTSDTAFTAIFAAIDESSLSEDVEVAKIGVYPNPISGFVTVEFEALQEHSLLRIADLGGRIVKTFDLSAGTESVRLDLRDLPSGVYTLMIGNTTKKLIVE